jgi:hypothetical protein
VRRGDLTARWLVAGALLATMSGVSSRARASGDIAMMLIPVLLPSELGAEVPIDERARAAGLVGWSYQLPLPLGGGARHRGIVGLGLLINGNGASCRGRAGYRYAYRNVFGGAGMTLDGRGYALSPEVGLKLLHEQPDPDPDGTDDVSLHVIVRAEIAKQGFESATLLLGWSLF